MKAFIVPAALVFLAALTSTAAQEKTAWDGVYSAAQAERGAKRYADNCAACHGEDMAGGPGIPGVVGIEFMFKYNGKPVSELFDYVKQNMPPGQAGSLTDPQYLDVVAAILKGNEFPAGSADLDPAALQGIRITKTKP
jgi:S-disulfanyl-L-cysteine oxidoreductase SoxD